MWRKAGKGVGGGVVDGGDLQQRNREIRATEHKMTIWKLLKNYRKCYWLFQRNSLRPSKKKFRV